MAVPSTYAELGCLIASAHGYGAVLVLGSAGLNGAILNDQRFSRRKFYALMGWVPLTFAVLSILYGPPFLVFFVAAGLSGIVMEVLVSLVWRAFFREPIWSYSYGAVASGFTSTLNVLPWAAGGLLFHATALVFRPWLRDEGFPLHDAVVFALALAAGVSVAWPLHRAVCTRGGAVSKRAFAIFSLPIALSAVALAVFSTPVYLLLMVTFAGVGFVTEYGYGRSMRVFFDRGLWVYHPWTIDEGHSSYVTFPLWSIGGLYFYFLSRAVGL
jgi:hypothetical protein